MENNIPTFFNKNFPSLKLHPNFKEELLSPGILFSIFYTKWKIELWKQLKTNAFVLREDQFKHFLMIYLEEGQEINVNRIQVLISNEVPPEERPPLLELKRQLFEAEDKLKATKNKWKAIENEDNTRFLEQMETLKMELNAYKKQKKLEMEAMDGKFVLPLQSNCEEYVKNTYFFLYLIIFSQ